MSRKKRGSFELQVDVNFRDQWRNMRNHFWTQDYQNRVCSIGLKGYLNRRDFLLSRSSDRSYSDREGAFLLEWGSLQLREGGKT